jgi:hypothetical protein
VNKGATLGKAGQPEAANNVLKAVESRFKTDASQSARLRIANALFNRACALRDLGDIDGELSLYTAINEKFGLEEDSQMRRQVAMALYNKAILLGKRGLESSYAESIETFEVIIKTYGGDESVAVKKEVAKALVGLGFGKMIHAKQRYNDKPNYFLLLAAAISSFELALKICAEDLRSIVYGNLGYGHFLAGRAAEAGEFTRLCLESGGGGMLSLQRADAQLNRISDIDSQYENLLDSIWDKIAPGS